MKRLDLNGSAVPGLAATQSAATLPADATFGPGPSGCPVLFVNGDSITVQEILEPIIQDLTHQASILGETGYRDYLVRAVSDEAREQISTLLVYQQAKITLGDKGKEALDKEADRLIKNMVTERFGGVHARFQAHLKALDLTEADMKEQLKRHMMVSQFLRERFLPMVQEPPRRELSRYYQAHLNELTTSAKAELFLIEIPIDKEVGKPMSQATADDIAAARRRARAQLNRAREELDSGVDFAAVARRYSKGLLKEKGGAWGEISPGSLTQHWAKAAEVLFSLQAGQVSDVIETDDAIFIVKCGGVTPRRQLSFEEAQQRIIEQVKDDQFRRLIGNYTQDLLNKAAITDKQRISFLQAVAAAAPRPSRPGLGTEDRRVHSR